MPATFGRDLLLRGSVVQPDGSARDRYVLIRDGIIRSVSRRRPPRSADAVYVEAGRNDWIFPGLLDLHTHTSSNLLPLWETDRIFGNRFEWRSDAAYRKEVQGFLRSLEKKPSWKVKAVFAELQAIAGGTTLLQEDWDLDGAIVEGGKQLLCRGTGSPRDLGLAGNREILSVIDFFFPNKRKRPWDPVATDKLKTYLSRRPRLQACLAHLAEGRAGILGEPDLYSRREFEALMKHPGMRRPEEVRRCPLALIHGCGIDSRNPEHLAFLRERAIGVVWSPVSNLLLYGDTPDVDALIADGITVALGSDWSPSGSKHVWDESKFARFYFDALGSEISDSQIFQMVTINPAALLGVDSVGRIAEGCRADFFILRSPRETDGAMEVFFNTDDRHVLAVIVGGRPIYGQRGFLSPFGLDFQALPLAEGTAVRDKVVHLPGIDVERDIEVVEREMKAKGRLRSNLLVSSDLPYRRRLVTLRERVVRYGWEVRRARHRRWKRSLAAATRVPPDAARVWTGFRRRDSSPAAFRNALGALFVPFTVGFAAPLGLNAYLLAVLPESRPSGAPDEVALVYYESQQVYRDSRETLAGRAYAALHETVFAATSRSEFPRLMKRTVRNRQPYYLFDEAVDWQAGTTRVLVGMRPPGVSDAAFRRSIHGLFDELRERRPRGLENVVFSVGDGCLVAWEHWESAGSAAGSRLAALAGTAEVALLADARPLEIQPALFDAATTGALESLDGGDCFSAIFTRRVERS